MMNARNTLGTGSNSRLRDLLAGLILALTALGLLAYNALGQSTSEPFDLVGSVVEDGSGQPLVGAFVSLTGSDWGSLSDEQGRFRLPDLDAGRVSLTVEQLGYETLVWEGRVGPGEALELTLVGEPILLEGLEVVADRFQSRRDAVPTTVVTYDRRALATSTHATILDFVGARAGSSHVACRGRHGDVCFRVRGRTVEPQVYIDEVPVLGGMDYLSTFAPHELYMVEIYARGRHIRAYTPQFMERAAKKRLQPIAFLF